MKTPMFSRPYRAGKLSFIFLVMLGIAATLPVHAGITAVSQSTAHADNENHLQISRPADVKRGDLLVAQVFYNKGSDVDVATPQHWTRFAKIDNGNNAGQALYYRTIDGSPGGFPNIFSFQFSQRTDAVGGIISYRGANLGVPVLQITEAVGTGDSPSAPGLDVEAGSLLVGFFGLNGEGELTEPAEMQLRYSLTNPGGHDQAGLVADEVHVGGPSGSRDASADHAGDWVAQLVGFDPTNIDPGQATITADPVEIVADGVSTSTITVQMQDENGNPVNEPGAILTLETSLGELAETSGSTDQNGQFTTTLTSATTAGTATISGTVNDVDVDDTAQVEFVPGDWVPGQTTVSADPAELTTGESSTITVQVRDEHGNPVAEPDVAISLETDLGELADTDGVTDGDGQFMTTLTSILVGTATVTGTADGTDFANSAQITFASGDFDASQTTVEANPTELEVGETSTVTVQVRDEYGNAVTEPDVAISLETDLGELAETDGVTDSGGQFMTTLTSTLAGTATVTGTADGADFANSAQVSFASGDFDSGQTTVEADPVELTTGESSTITVQVRDEHGNPVAEPDVAISLETDLGELADTDGVTDGDGQFMTTLTSTLAGTATVTGTADGTDFANSAQITFASGDFDASQTTVEANPTELEVGETSTITVQVRDEYGNAVAEPDVTISLETDLGDLVKTDGVTDSGGQFMTILTSTQAGTATVTGTADGSDFANSAQVSFASGDFDSGQTTVEADPVELEAGETSTITVQVRDEYGNAVTEPDVAISLENDLGELAETDGVTDGDGQFMTTLTSTLAGTATVTGTADGTDFANSAEVTFTASDFDASQTTINADPEQLAAGQTSTIIVQVRDEHGNAVAEPDVAISLETDLGELAETDGVTDASGQFETGLTSTATGTATVTGSANGESFDDTAEVQFELGEGLNELAFDQQPPDSAGGGEFSVTVQIVDEFGNVDTDADDEVSIVLTEADGATLSGDTTIEAVEGVAVFDGLSVDQAGFYTLTASAAGLGEAESDSFEIFVGEPAALEFDRQPRDGVIDGPLMRPVTVHVVDQGGNLVTSASHTIEMAIETGPEDAGISGDTEIDAVDGVAEFTNLIFDTLGHYTITASNDELDNAISDVFEIRVDQVFRDRFEVTAETE